MSGSVSHVGHRAVVENSSPSTTSSSSSLLGLFGGGRVALVAAAAAAAAAAAKGRVGCALPADIAGASLRQVVVAAPAATPVLFLLLVAEVGQVVEVAGRVLFGVLMEEEVLLVASEAAPAGLLHPSSADADAATDAAATQGREDGRSLLSPLCGPRRPAVVRRDLPVNVRQRVGVAANAACADSARHVLVAGADRGVLRPAR